MSPNAIQQEHSQIIVMQNSKSLIIT